MLSGISGKFDQRHEERIDKEIAAKGGQKNEIDIRMITLDSIDNIAATKIDFISIDTAGNEFEIIKAIDLKNLDITEPKDKSFEQLKVLWDSAAKVAEATKSLGQTAGILKVDEGSEEKKSFVDSSAESRK